MTSLLSFAGIMMLIGTALMLYATVQAVRYRTDPRRLILWGAVHDVGIVVIAITTQSALGTTGACMFAIFQLCTRLLAWSALSSLRFQGGETFKELLGVGRQKPYAAALYALGMLAAVGGSPFLVPEGRAFIVDAVFDTMGSLGLGCLMLMAAATTAFIWLHVDAICKVWLEEGKDKEQGSYAKDHNFLALGLAAIVALLGIFRVGFAQFCGGMVEAPATHPAYLIFYIGAFVTGIAYFIGLRYSAFLGLATSVIAFIAVCCSPAAPLAQLFLIMVTVIGVIVSLYSVGYIHERKGWYWFFLLLTFASLTGIVSAHGTGNMYGYWELMTFASYFLVVHERRQDAFAAGLKYYVMCAGGALFMLPGLHLLGHLSP
ncbi:MAG: oxidoreductase, partial [Desulfovibrio sp.]|nr:oxidoreductase [Desulfovibrio sp.]